MRGDCRFFCVWASLAAAACVAGPAAAQPPDVVRHYRFLPHHSTLEVSGGFAGFELTFFPYGEFGLVTGYRPDDTSPHPVLRPYAQFVEVDDTWLVPDSPLAYIWWLDETLNLSSLEGTFDDPHHLFFHGTDGQGWPIRIEATLEGHLLHLTGENEPGCCDFFHYKLDALARLLPHGDFNHDGVVDAADYTVWRDGLHADGMTHAEYDRWKRSFGESADTDMSLVIPAGDLAAVPEPGTLWLLMIAIVVRTIHCRCRPRR